jgi:hypothetical protein
MWSAKWLITLFHTIIILDKKLKEKHVTMIELHRSCIHIHPFNLEQELDSHQKASDSCRVSYMFSRYGINTNH